MDKFLPTTSIVEDSWIFGTVFVKIFKPGNLKEFPSLFAGLFVCLLAGKAVQWIYLRRCQWIFSCSMGLHMRVHGFVNGYEFFSRSYGVVKGIYEDVIEILSSLKLDKAIQDLCGRIRAGRWGKLSDYYRRKSEKDGHTIISSQVYVRKCCFWYKEN